MRIIKNAVKVYSHGPKNIFHNCIRNGKFPDIKVLIVTDKCNYRHISTLSNFLKIFKKLIYNQANSVMEPKLLKYLESHPLST